MTLMTPHIKTIFVKSEFEKTYREKTIRRKTGKMKEGLFGGLKPEKIKEKKLVLDRVSDCKIDGSATSDSVNQVITDLVKEGFKILSITPVTSGSYKYDYRIGSISSNKRIFSDTESVYGNSGYSYGYGFSYTEGVLILAEHEKDT